MLRLTGYGERLQRSFAAAYDCLEKPRIAWRMVIALLAIHTGLLAYSAYVHSPTLNEPGHLVAGLSNRKFGRFDIYSVNPPLVRMVAALPVMAVGYAEDWSSYHTGPGARPEFSMGLDFAAANGERTFFLFMIARWACIPFSWLGGIICYLWARDLYSRPAGVMACTIWCFEPNILAHASLMTPDAHATALGLAACYTFWRWLKKPTWAQAALTGAVLGLAELTKTTLILFYPLWPLMWLVYRWPDRGVMRARDWLREAGMLAVRMAIGLYVLNLGYGFEGSLKPLGDFQFVSNLFTGAAEGEQEIRLPAREQLAESSSVRGNHNRFAHSWLAAVPVPFPANYLVGLDLQQHDFEDYGRPSYLRGEWRDHGWWYYYLYAVMIKVPLGLWALGVFALSLRIRGRAGGNFFSVKLAPRNDSFPAGLTASLRDEFILLLPPLTIFAVVSSKTGFSEHMRYVLPTLPFLVVWVSGNCLTSAIRAYNAPWPRRRTVPVPLFPVNLIAIVWLVASSLSIYPHSLAYFNESIGGPLNGSRHLLGSNIDWGQDLLYLKRWMREHAEARPFHLAYHGNVDPSNLGFSGTLPWQSQFAVSAEKGEHRENATFESGSYAISVSLLRGSTLAARDGVKSQNSDPRKAYAKAQTLEPTAHAGYSIWIFR